VKNVVQKGDGGIYHITTPKTITSTRTLPVPERVIKNLQKLFEQENKQYGFSLKWFVFGDKGPLSAHILRHNKNKFTEEACVKQIRIHDFRYSCTSVLIVSWL
jgi:hypothetical protein